MDVFGPAVRVSTSRLVRLATCAFICAMYLASPAFGQDPAPADAPAPTATTQPEPSTPASAPAATAEPPQQAAGAPKTMTLWDMVKAGGTVMIVIMLLSVAALSLVIYFMVTLTPAREVPLQFVKRAQAQIRAGDLRGAYQMCEDRDEFIANVLRAGLRMHGHDRYVIQEAMESEGERRAALLWQRISYLNNIGVIAPMLGLLGTVTGMMGAFGAIAYNDAQSKSIVMAYNVAQALVTTAAGLVLGIIAFIFYYYLRGRVVTIIAHVEAHASEFVELLTGKGPIE